MIPLLGGPIRSVLCIGAHADDIEIGCGGTILKLLATHRDFSIRWVVLSADGARADEARMSAERFLQGAGGTSRVDVAGFEDASFPYADGPALKRYFRELTASCTPDLVFTHRREDLHQDHRFVAELTWQHFRDHMILEYEIPKYEGDLGQPSVFVPLPETFAEAKIDALVSAFPSQADKTWFSADTFRALMRVRGVECRAPSGLAEAFHCRKLVLV